MKATDGVYFQERVNYYNQFKGTLLKSFNKNISDVNKNIPQRVNAFDN